MENKELISVIVPVYNVEKYLKYSVDSILNQTYKNLEIILVDDGSTDNSAQICDEYKSLDNRIKVIHKTNGGLADARNAGIAEAKGMYIGFADSDDYIHPSFFEELYNLIKNNNAEIAECEFLRIDVENVGNAQKIIEDENKKAEIKAELQTNQKALELLYGPQLKPYIKKVVVWNKLYKKELFNELKFPLGRLHEDEFTTFKILNNADKIVSSNKILHGYIQTKNSIMRAEIKLKRINDNLEAYIESSEYFKKQNNTYIEMQSRRRYLENCIELAGKVSKEQSQDKEQKLEIITKLFKSYFEKYIEEIEKNNKDEKTCVIIYLLKDAYNSLKETDFINEKYWKELEIIINKEQELFNKMKNSNIKILGIEDSLRKIAEEKKSICRFGDGELDIIFGKNIGFQKSTPELAKKLEEILKNKQNFCFVGVPDAINNFDNITDESKAFWIKNMLENRDNWMKYLNPEMTYLTANLTRLYIRYKDKSNCAKYFGMLKNIWKDRNVVICEGEQTRIGVGNDLLDECKSITRIICPSENAFDKYQEILEALKKEDKNSLFLIALGPTATLLAYEMAKNGFQALDVGHFDIEYEWFLRNATHKEKIENKYTNEVKGGNSTENVRDENYLKQIKKIIR